MSVTYTATLPVHESTVLFASGLLYDQRRRLGTRAGTRALGCFKQAVLVLRRLLDGTGSRSWPPTTRSAARRGTPTCTRASPCSPPTVASKKPKNTANTDVQQQFNRAHNAVRPIGERGNSLLKTTGGTVDGRSGQSRP
jgi:hypothetical protein